MYSKELIEQVKSAVNIVDVISDYQTLFRRGKHYLGVCPFHNDTTPSLTVNPGMQIYKCFACGASGDVFSYVQHAEGCSFTEALRIVAAKGHVELPEQAQETDEERQARIHREQLKQQNTERQREYEQGRDNPFYLQYLDERAISPEAADVFCLGYAASGEFAFRITYPMFTVSGQIAGWQARIVPHIEENGKQPKYKNSAESELFHKDELLFGLKQARQEIQKQDRAYIVEGQNDVIRMWMSGKQNTVAGSGTAFSEKQARLLQRFTRNVVLMYDGDNAGRKATLRTLRLLLQTGFTVWVCEVPDKEDPDSWLLALSKNAKSKKKDTLTLTMENHTRKWFDYLRDSVFPNCEDADTRMEHLRELTKMIAAVPNRLVRQQLIRQTSIHYQVETSDIKRLVNTELGKILSVQKAGTDDNDFSATDWQQNIYGLEEAKQMNTSLAWLTFSKDTFIEHLDDTEMPWLLYQGELHPVLIQQLREFTHLTIEAREITADASEDGERNPDDSRQNALEVLLALHKDGRHLQILMQDDIRKSFTDWYIDSYTRILQDEDPDSGTRTNIIRLCMEVIADTDRIEREVNTNEYRRKLALPANSFKALLQELLAERKDKREAERKRLQLAEKTANVGLYGVPEYVENNEVLKKQYEQYGFFPLYRNLPNGADLNDPDEQQDVTPVAYVFKNDKGEGHSIVSDFYMEALLFVDPATDHSKRVVRINHLHGGSQYVEWPSDVFVSLTDIKKRLFASGAYNFNGTPQQWDRIRQLLSYNFTDCYEARVYGWQPEGFLMLPNAVYYPETTASDDERAATWRLQYMDTLGVAEVNGMRFYSPASSSIRLSGRKEDNPYEQDEYAYYLEPQGKDRMNFRQWATLMNEVFSVNENGKWAVMFAIACNFRDFIYSVVGNFTALCFAGPTGSGKTELAYGIRGLWMRRKASVFNLNSGTDAAFFMVLEHFRNMPVIMEEYNDNGISAQKFQGLKAAVYDDQGRVKVKDMASKSTDASKTNAAPILLGQDTPQQDDGSLSNRVIICEVPRKEGGFTPAETEQFERLKRQSEVGLGNVLCEIVRQRPVFERHYKTVYFEEVQRLKKDTWQSTTNKEGLERVIRSVAIMSATARLIEERGSITLPWKYAEFYVLATEKIVRQMESISTTSKLGMFFAALNTLMGTGRVLYGRELKVVKMKEPTLQVKDGTGQKRVEVGDGASVLYLHFDGCYSAYCKEVARDVLTKQTLTNYFRSNSAYIGVAKSTRFSWMEADFAASHSSNRDDQTTYANKQMVQKSFISSAYLFKYDIIQDLFDVDFERLSDESGNSATSDPQEPTIPLEENPFA